jgi:hypothetical protein
MSEFDFSQHHIILTITASAVSYAVTQIAKPFLKKIGKEKSVAVIKLFAVITGGLVGWSLSYAIVDLWLGAGAGGMNTFLVKLIKKKAQSSLGVDPSASEDSASKDSASKGKDA